MDKMIGDGLRAIDDLEGREALKPKHIHYIRAAKEGEAKIDEHALRSRLGELEYPLYFFDFETVNPPIPRFDGTGPWEQVPFQYGVHVMEEPGGPLEHRDYLHNGEEDPRPELTRRMMDDFDTSGSIIVYHVPFERGCLERLRDAGFGGEKRLNQFIDRLWDQRVIFTSGAYVHPDFQGSTSIKVVLPAVVPGYSYDDLDVQNGTVAQQAYERLTTLPPGTGRRKLRETLRAYCRRDTRAMVEIHRMLRSMIG